MSEEKEILQKIEEEMKVAETVILPKAQNEFEYPENVFKEEVPVLSMTDMFKTELEKNEEIPKRIVPLVKKEVTKDGKKIKINIEIDL